VYSQRRTGSVTSEGDALMRATLARANVGVTGQGVRVGIISDSLSDAATSINSGDLPPTITIVNGQDGGTVSRATDEGRAMAEIIHDLAPGAQLLFRTGFPTSLDFIAAVQELTAAGAHVIVDDIGFFNEPVFEEGPVAQAVRQAIQQGVVFVSAAGNDALSHYQETFREAASAGGEAGLALHDFGGGETHLEVRIGANSLVVIFLQWTNPFDGSANTADYDLILADAHGNTLAISNDDQLGTRAQPLETLFFPNVTGRPITASVAIQRVGGAALPFALHFNSRGRVTVLNHNIPAGSIFGHACVRDVLTVGAVDVSEPGFATLEDFSSQGPCELFFPTRELRTKPDIAAADGVVTSLPDFTPFFGTSAAAPHVAAVAALMIEAAGGPGVVSNTRISNTLRRAAVERGAPGVDNRFGHGVVDALLAVQAIRATTNTAPRSVIDGPGTDLTVPPNTVVTFQGQCVDAEGDQPFVFAWDFGRAAPPSAAQQPGDIRFSTLGVFPVTLTCTDARGRTDTTPARRTITVSNLPESRITSPTTDVVITAGSNVSFAGACTDPDNDVPFTFFWHFGGTASPSAASVQEPGAVVFNTPGDFTVTFACTDALGALDVTPATVRVTVNPVQVARANAGKGGGGGGCTLSPQPDSSIYALLETFGHFFLPVLALYGLRRWGWRLRCQRAPWRAL